MKFLVLSTLVSLSGCAEIPSIQFEPSDKVKIFGICEKYQKPKDHTEHYQCNTHKLLNIKFKF